jgi:hypothetical protein
MGYYMRYIVTEDTPLQLSDLEAGLKAVDPKYVLERDEVDDVEAVLIYDSAVYGHIFLNVPGDDLFNDEIGELLEFVEEATGDKKHQVVEVLKVATSLFCIQVLDQGRTTTEGTLEKIDPIWAWMFENKRGLMQADGEGYYDRTGLILEVQ